MNQTIADLVGHAGTRVTEQVYRHQLKLMITEAGTIDTIFGDSRKKRKKFTAGRDFQASARSRRRLQAPGKSA